MSSTAVDSIEFFGQKFRSTLPDPLDRQMEEKYTYEQVYWLDIGGTAGPRVIDVTGTPQGNLTAPTSYPTTVHAEVDRYRIPLWSLNYDTRDTWYWDLAYLALPRYGHVDHPDPYVHHALPCGGLHGQRAPGGAPGEDNPGGRQSIASGHPDPGEHPGGGFHLERVGPPGGRRHRAGRPADQPDHQPHGPSFDPDARLRPKSTCSSTSGRWTTGGFSARSTTSSTFRAEAAGTRNSAPPISRPARWRCGTSPPRLQPKRLSGVATTGAGPSYSVRFQAEPAVGRSVLDAGRGELRRPGQHRPAVEHRGAAESGRRRRHGDRDAGVPALRRPRRWRPGTARTAGAPSSWTCRTCTMNSTTASATRWPCGR